jgi:ribonuclease H / adenosylcobalamin/alpha-ribazole phosphatase
MSARTRVVHFVRHGAHGLLGHVLAGRIEGVPLGEAGRAQAERTAERLAGLGITAIQSSPLERCFETAEIIGRRLDLPVEPVDALLEIDFGDWSGCRFDQLELQENWRRWNHFRSGTRPPGGETIWEAQTRILRHIETLTGSQAGAAEAGSIVLVTHSDLIKVALAHYLGMPPDLFLRLEISPASISTVEIGGWGPRILRINEDPS